jgi:cell division septation protein DedD
MPSINLKDDEMEQEPIHPVTPEAATPEAAVPPPSLREGPVATGPSPLVQILLLLTLLAVVTFGLNYFGVIHLWGKKAPQVVEAPPPLEQPIPKTEEQPSPTTETPAQTVEPKVEATPTPTPIPKKEPTQPTTQQTTPTAKVIPPLMQPPAGEGKYTLQISSWTVRARAGKEVTRLQQAGHNAYIQTGDVGGVTRYRVRVGRYATQAQAQADVGKLAGLSDGGPIVTRIDRK